MRTLRRLSLEDMRQLMGFERNSTTADVKKQGDSDMKTYGSGIADEASRTYRKVLETVHAELLASAAREAKQKAEFKRDPGVAARKDRRRAVRGAIFLTTAGTKITKITKTEHWLVCILRDLRVLRASVVRSVWG